MDELYTYTKKSNPVGARTAVNRNGLCFTAFEVGAGKRKTLKSYRISWIRKT
jgi:hypothetical protein